MTASRVSYRDVRKIHPQHQGIYSKNGIAKSIIFSIGEKSLYPDRWIIKDSLLEYSAQSSGDNISPLWNRYNIPLRRALEERQLVHAFEKEAVRPVTYLDHGEWSVVQFLEKNEEKTGRKMLRFVLSKEPYGTLSSVYNSPIIAPNEVADDVYEPPARYLAMTHRIIRDTVLARKLKQAYGFRCQICGTTRKNGTGESYAEAHHIRPLGHPHDGPDAKENLVVLCPNHHADFDLGAISIDPSDGRTIVHRFEKAIDGSAVHFERGHRFNREYIRYHHDHVFIAR